MNKLNNGNETATLARLPLAVSDCYMIRDINDDEAYEMYERSARQQLPHLLEMLDRNDIIAIYKLVNMMNQAPLEDPTAFFQDMQKGQQFVESYTTLYYNESTLLQTSVKNHSKYKMANALCGGFVSGLVVGPSVTYEPPIKGVTFFTANTDWLKGITT